MSEGKVRSLEGNPQPQKELPPLRFVTAASLFDGHDASINIMRRILQSLGVEVIHLAHNRSVAEVVQAALQEDAQGIAISSYQGGHVEYFKYVVDMLKENNASHIKVFGGGGGVIVPEEIQELHDYGVARIYSPQDGMTMGLVGMIQDMVDQCRVAELPERNFSEARQDDYLALSAMITAIEQGEVGSAELAALKLGSDCSVPVLGITGTGGAGKSSLTDEIIRRFRIDSGDSSRIAILAIDPTRRKTGGALLGDRIRMNSIYTPNTYMRSIATRHAAGEVPPYLSEIIAATRKFDFDLIVVETPGIGQGDAGIVPYVDASMYVMTPEFGAQSQLEKIDMLDFADLVVINKFDRQGAEDALRDVAKQVQRNREAFDQSPEEHPVYGTIASRFGDDGVSAAYFGLLSVLRAKGLRQWQSTLAYADKRIPSERSVIVPAARARYLAEIAETVRGYHRDSADQVRIARERHQLQATARMLGESDERIDKLIEQRNDKLTGENRRLLENWPAFRAGYQGEELVETTSSGKEVRTRLGSETLSGNWVSRVAVPEYEDEGEILRFLKRENMPGYFPFTAGVFPFKREGEDPARMFAGEGDPARTNRRFKKLSEHSDAKRLSTAFDSVTLYGFDPATRPDIYGKIGNSGVSIATLDDMKVLYDGFDLCDPMTSVSMTINGPAPAILAMFLNTAIDQQLAEFKEREGREPGESEQADIRAYALANVRGTVQADILKEDQGQNTCIFSTEFSLRMMGDIQQYFIDNQVRNFYSVSISGYHIAEAGANPISQLTFTLANGFTFVEAYLARGMDIDDFAPNLSFFFSNGMDPEYTVIGRVARRIWAVTMREKYGANERSQKLKYHIQTSGRSLHAQEMQFNDIRTTLQALLAINDNCNSLHTNAYDEAITTPTEESVRRALAIQLIINREFGVAKTENPSQGAFIVDELTDLVEEAVLREFERISDRGGVLGAMETGYQRGNIQEESMKYETLKHDGSLPIIGVNTFRPESEPEATTIELARSTEEEKRSQIARVEDFQARHKDDAERALAHLKATVTEGGNGFTALMEAVRHCSLGQLTDAFFEVGGQYRRNT
ncbi:MAG: methylmalonyl-CoA mutase family protein [Pseudomonadales bacterium]|jgi:methylmalonyl-CoA mutase|nr:methylmalonyl-CoA mutase family protein [Pseudomonadales bacterium]MDP6472415.1 methylmalonyl-CoA mutase family protein [Pseudomonadales bacterium]MDP6828211.1 methylmalonyl-CoA mutase family protein [Pseudomonadales bacterium]